MSLDPRPRLVGLALGTTAIYFIWLAIVAHPPLGYIFLTLEAALYLLLILFVYNDSSPRYEVLGGRYSMRGLVDVLIPTKNEAEQLLEPTLRAAAAIAYASKRLYVLDDGDRPWVKALAKRYGATYLVRPNRRTHPGKANNLNFGLSQSFGSFILVLDADQIARPEILDDMLGHFRDPKVALVTSRQEFRVSEDDFNNDYLFYGYMQAGKSASYSPISTGSGVIYRRSALSAIHGFQTWNLLEDLYTSFVLNQHGYRSLYVNQAYTSGEAPRDLAVIYKQRGTWAHDTLRFWIWRQPLFARGLRFRQRLQYFEMGYIYFVSAVIIPGIYALSFYSLFTNIPILVVGWWYLLFRLPSFYTTLHMYDELGRNSASSRMWAALYPVFLWSLLKALLYVKPRIGHVTKKARQVTTHPALVVPQLLTIAVGVYAFYYHYTHFGITLLFSINAFWFVVMIYWMWPVFPRAFGKLKRPATHAQPQAA
ncbi:MAG: glycosyltransferase [Candidatus Andersenbacteria bacterium]